MPKMEEFTVEIFYCKYVCVFYIEVCYVKKLTGNFVGDF